jgi:beta-N-acetylhexosaminidase
MSRIDASVKRILDAKARLSFAVADPDVIFDTVDSEESREIATEIATRAMTLVREENKALPLAKTARVIVVGVSDFPETTNPVAELDREFRNRLDKPPQTFTLDPRSNDNDVAPIADAAKDADVILFALAIRARSGAGQIAVPDVAQRAIEKLASSSAKQIAISFGTPYLLREIPSVPTYICAYGPQPVLQIAAARALFGEAKMTGKLPVTIPGFYDRGHGITR